MESRMREIRTYGLTRGTITECFRRGGVETRNYASAFALAAVLTAAALAPFAASAGSATLKCSGYTGTETLTDFQALIKLDEGRYGFSYADCTDQAAGTDVWFSSDAAGNNVLEREIDTWNPDGSWRARTCGFRPTLPETTCLSAR